MTTTFWKRAVWMLGALALAGCELAGGIPELPATAALSVSVEDLSGSVNGMVIAPEMAEASGLRTGSQVHFIVELPQQTSVLIDDIVEDSATEDPYGGLTGPPVDDPSLLQRPDGTFAQVCIASECREADALEIDSVQRIDGREVSLSGDWSRGDQLLMRLHYHELR